MVRLFKNSDKGKNSKNDFINKTTSNNKEILEGELKEYNCNIINLNKQIAEYYFNKSCELFRKEKLHNWRWNIQILNLEYCGEPHP